MIQKNKLPFKIIPDIPDEIIEAIDDKKLLIFIGAGVSKLYGYPLWRELGEKLTRIAVEDDAMTLSEKEVLLTGNFTPMEIVTIASKKLDIKGKRKGIDYTIDELNAKVIENKKISNRIAKYLAAYNAPIITTNADTSLDENKYLMDRYPLIDFLEYNPGPHNNLSLIHLHGCVSNPESMIFTSEQYAKAYRVDSDFGRKLSDLFNDEWVILFLGYGITEFELLRYFLKDKNNEVKRLFMVDGYLEKDSTKYNLDKEYFNSLGIKLLPYSREKNDYLGLIDVLKSWDKDVRKRTLAGSINRKNAIESIISQPPTKEGVKIIEQMVKKHG